MSGTTARDMRTRVFQTAHDMHLQWMKQVNDNIYGENTNLTAVGEARSSAGRLRSKVHPVQWDRDERE